MNIFISIIIALICRLLANLVANSTTEVWIIGYIAGAMILALK